MDISHSGRTWRYDSAPAVPEDASSATQLLPLIAGDGRNAFILLLQLCLYRAASLYALPVPATFFFKDYSKYSLVIIILDVAERAEGMSAALASDSRHNSFRLEAQRAGRL